MLALFICAPVGTVTPSINAARSGSPAPLSDEEKARIAALLDEHDRQGGGSGAV